MHDNASHSHYRAMMIDPRPTIHLSDAMANPSSLADLLQLERSALLRWVHRLLGADAGAEDVVQSIWLKARRADGGSIDNPRAYLYRMASNLAADHHRDSARRARLLADHYLHGPDEVISAEQQVIARDELERVLLAAERLPEPTRSIFRQHRLEGLTQAEVARRRGVSTTTVENHVREALRQLSAVRRAS